MSLWSKLAKIGGYVAAPFTGGASIPIGNAVAGGLEMASGGAGNAAQSMANNRGAKAAGQIDYDQNVMQNERDFLKALLEREANTRKARNDAFNNTARADFVGRGGLRGLMSKEGQAGLAPRQESQMEAADALRRSARPYLEPGDPLEARFGAVQRAPITGREDFEKNFKSSGWEKLLGILSGAAGVAGGVAGGFNRQSPAMNLGLDEDGNPFRG